MAKPADFNAKRRPHSIDCSGPSMTQQSFKDECDINMIMAKYERTGLIDFARDLKDGRYVDLASVADYHTSMSKVTAAQEAFEALPAKVRAAMDNDPAVFLSFLNDPKNYEKALELGLVTKRPEPPVGSGSGGSPSATPPAASGDQAAKG